MAIQEQEIRCRQEKARRRGGYGMTPDADLALTLGWQSQDGGFLDGLIEDIHKLGQWR